MNITGLFAPGMTQLSAAIPHGLPGSPHISLMLITPVPQAANPNSTAPGGLNFALTPFISPTSEASFRIAATMLATRFGDGSPQQMTLTVRWAVVTP